MKSTTKLLPILALSLTACASSGYRNNSPVVEQKFVHKYGVPVARDDWSNRGKDGQVISVLKTGVTKTETYANGILDGETTYTYPHVATIERRETYTQGTLIKEISYDTAGAPIEEVVYNNDYTKDTNGWYENGAPKYREHYDNDDLLETGEYYTLSNQLASSIKQGNGTRVNYDQYGLLESRDVIKDGKMVQKTTYYPNGAPKEVIPYQDGVIVGLRRTFHHTGEPNTIEEWSDGEQHGITTVYHNGEVSSEVPYVNGEKHGVERRYRNENDLVEEISWANGDRHGPSTTYVGGKANTEWYYQGAPINQPKK